ncbi:MAG: energy-coupling factor transporter transmembrane protein EcfT [Propionibacteriaceae bacterium]|nr:energy-coupling factor transporter transmembrane protein EcfT [Propionibacteriaceae bacterium]
MNVDASLVGVYQPQDGWLFRMSTGKKYLLVLVLSVPPFIVERWWFTVAMLLLTALLMRSSGIAFRRIFRLGVVLWIVVVLLAGYQLFSGKYETAVTAPGNVLTAILASRLLTLTTSTPELLEALIRGMSPLRKIRVNVDQLALMVAIMMRSIPYLLGSFQNSRDAARARGRDGSLLSLMVPTMIDAVAYAQRTGDAVHARGLAERESVELDGSPAKR